MSAMTVAAHLPQLWAGVECTVNRVGDDYSDQLERTGHALRLKDLERLAELGVRRLRYPVLWERTARRFEHLCVVLAR
jgi:dTDP-4-dehydrorhamnose reductase